MAFAAIPNGAVQVRTGEARQVVAGVYDRNSVGDPTLARSGSAFSRLLDERRGYSHQAAFLHLAAG